MKDYINFEKQKNSLYFTLSVILKENYKTYQNQKAIKALIDIQKRSINAIQKDKKITPITGINQFKKILKEGKESIIYQYPLDRLHFSLFNFPSLCRNLGDKDFEKERKNIEKGEKDFFQKIKMEMERIKMETEKFPASARICKIYIPSQKIIGGSLALNIYPEDQDWFSRLENIKEDVKKRLSKQNIQDGTIDIKAYPDGSGNRNFAINIIRFIDSDERRIENCYNFYKEIEDINKELKNDSISFRIETITPVISDPYLSNNSPPLL